jgi:hypothetical protein
MGLPNPPFNKIQKVKKSKKSGFLFFISHQIFFSLELGFSAAFSFLDTDDRVELELRGLLSRHAAQHSG